MTPNATEGESTEVVTALLRRFDWAPRAKVPGRYEVWTLGEDSDREVLVPVNPENGDFGSLLSRAMRQVQAWYGPEAERLRQQLQLTSNADLDTTRWKKDTPVDAGLIPWVEGESMFGAAKEQLDAAARATNAKRLVMGNSGAHLAKRFLEQTLMGQTEVGSYIITAYTPASALFHRTRSSERQAETDPRKADRVTGRSIIETFQAAVDGVREALDDYKRAPRLDGFKDLVEVGASHELIRALAVLAKDGDAAIGLEFSGRNTGEKEVVFDSSEAPVLETVAAQFASAPEPKQVHLVGEVSLLDNSTVNPIHLVRLDVKRGSDRQRVRVRLTATQYEVAVEAHATHRWVSVKGTLEKDGRDWWLYHATGFMLAPADEGPTSTPVELFDASREEDG